MHKKDIILIGVAAFVRGPAQNGPDFVDTVMCSMHLHAFKIGPRFQTDMVQTQVDQTVVQLCFEGPGLFDLSL